MPGIFNPQKEKASPRTQLTFSVSTTEHAKIKSAARNATLAVSEYCRQGVIFATDSRAAEDTE